MGRQMISIAIRGRRGAGQFATVDPEDCDLAARAWSLHSAGYAVAWVQGGLKLLHKVIGARMGHCGEIDHRNRQRLDCRRSNLRPATSSLNKANRPAQVNNTSGYKGVARCGPKWRAYITLQRRQHHLGCFDSKHDAARAYNSAAVAHFGEFACLNVIEA